jgi:hypothetical protein
VAALNHIAEAASETSACFHAFTNRASTGAASPGLPAAHISPESVEQFRFCFHLV